MAITTPSDRTTRWDTPSPPPPGPPPPGPPHNVDRPRRRGYLIAAIITLAVVTAVVVAGLALAGGSNQKVAASTPPASTPQATTPASVTPTTAPQLLSNAAILGAYKSAESLFLADATQYPANALDPSLADHFSGADLNRVQNYLTGLRIQGHHAIGTWVNSPVVTSISGSSATITDCVFDHTSIVNGRTGQQVSGADTVTTKNTITLVLDGGTWKVSDNQRVGTGCIQSA